jgi:ankyrin repeat protein
MRNRLAPPATLTERLLDVVRYDTNLEEIQALLAAGADPNAPAAAGCRPLHHACYATPPNLAVLRALLNHGADVNARTTDDATAGETALHIAIFNANQPLAQLLIDHGANANLTCHSLETPPIIWAVLRQNTHMVGLLLSDDKTTDLTHESSRYSGSLYQHLYDLTSCEQIRSLLTRCYLHQRNWPTSHRSDSTNNHATSARLFNGKPAHRTSTPLGHSEAEYKQENGKAVTL